MHQILEFRERITNMKYFKRVIKGLGAGVLFISIFFNVNTIVQPTHVYAEVSTSSGFTSDQMDALNLLNEVRAKSGVQPLKLNQAINQAAQSHAKYYNLHKDDLSGLKAHSEYEGTTGFTGKTPGERLKAAGWVFSKKIYTSAGEVMHFGQSSSSGAVQGWLDTAYHRNILLGPDFQEVGFGLEDGTAVANFGRISTYAVTMGDMAVYPYDGQTDVPVGFYGNEIPDPLQQFGIKYSGYIISATTKDDIISHQASIRDENGDNVEFFEEVYRDKTIFLYPKDVLKGKHTYQVTVDVQTKGSSESHIKRWSFTTGKGASLINLTSNLSEIILNEGGKTKVSFRGEYSDGVAYSITDGVSYTSSNIKGLSISNSGELLALKKGKYTVTATYEGQSTEFSVQVFPKWKTKSYNTKAINLPTDISGHPLQSILEWGIENGILAPAKDGLLHPEGPVSEAEFWTMLLKTYNVDISAYQTGKSKHWADAAYSIAKERNYPLTGIVDLKARNNPITRGKIAEIISAADSMNVEDSNAVTYVLAKDYMRAVTDVSLSGFQRGSKVTRGEALNILKYVRGTLGEIKARPLNETPESALPKMPSRKVYEKPNQLEDDSMYANFQKDGKLIVEGKFTRFSNKNMTLSVYDKDPLTKTNKKINVLFDSEGNFHLDAGTYPSTDLILYLVTPGIEFYLPIQRETMNYSHYTNI